MTFKMQMFKVKETAIRIVRIKIDMKLKRKVVGLYNNHANVTIIF